MAEPGSRLKSARFLREIFHSPTLRAAMAFGSAGAAFALGNLMLAGSMPVEAYGRFAIAISFFNIFNALAPLGLDIFLVRSDVAPDVRLFIRASLGGALVGVLAGAIAVLAYDLPIADGVLLALALFGVAIGATAGGSLRSRGRVTLAFFVTNLSNWAVLAAGVIGLFLVWQQEMWALVLLASPSLVLAFGGWLAARNAYDGERDRVRIPLIETLSLLGLQLALSVAIQLERLIAPHALDISAVAQFNVLASVAIFPFRTLAAATALMLVPRLRLAKDYGSRRSALRQETMIIALALVGAIVTVLLFAPWIVRFLTGGKYEVGLALLLAGCFNGCPKMLQAIPQAMITAYGSARDLVALNSLSWLSIATGAAGALFGARWGLEGLVVGAAIGGLVMLLPSLVLAIRVMRNTAE